MARRADTPNALVAAARRVNLADRKTGSGGPRIADWQNEAWAYFDDVPEVKYSVWFLGNALSKLRLFAGTRPAGADPDDDPVPVDADESGISPQLAASANAEMDRLRSGTGGHAGILRRGNMNLEIAAECYLVGLGARPPDMDGKGGRPESWTIRSMSEVELRSGVWIVKDGPSDTTGTPLDPDSDACIRLWQEHPRWAGMADCAMRGVLGECKTLQVLSQQVLAQAMRAASAGFFTIPNELSFQPTTTVREDGSEATVDPLMDTMAEILMGPIGDPSDPASVQPGLLRGPAQYLTPDVLRLIRLWDPSIDDSLEQRINARINRIARGLNLPVEVVMGHQATTYANAEQVDQDTFEDHLEPRCALLVEALTIGFLRPNLIDAGYPADEVARVVVAYDASALVAQPDVDANAVDAHEKGTISDAAYRRARGFTEDDAPDPVELLIRSGLRRGTLSPVLTVALIQAIAAEAGVVLPTADELAATPQGGAGAPPASADGIDLHALAQVLLAARAGILPPGGGARGRGIGGRRPPA